MKTPNEERRPEEIIVGRSKRARLDSLLFRGAKLGATALLASAFLAPKLPPFFGE
jgi:hypothetical protein